MYRLLFPVILGAAAIVYGVYVLSVKKDIKAAKGIFSLTVFFGVIWVGIYYFIFK